MLYLNDPAEFLRQPSDYLLHVSRFIRETCYTAIPHMCRPKFHNRAVPVLLSDRAAPGARHICLCGSIALERLSALQRFTGSSGVSIRRWARTQRGVLQLVLAGSIRGRYRQLMAFKGLQLLRDALSFSLNGFYGVWV